jgi:transcriptional regulator with XRE-family HTH domain
MLGGRRTAGGGSSARGAAAEEEARPVAGQIGTLLWELRTAGNWTLGQLARQAGVSKSALSQWESGTRQPRVTELEAVLDALNADAAHRALVLAGIDAPRALRRLRQPAVSPLGPPPTAGDLLRAMRRRRDWTQEQAAAAAGVRRGALMRWERGERLPASEQVQALCYALGAREEELVALTTGAFTATPVEAPATWEEAAADLGPRYEALRRGECLGLEELTCLMLEREAWGWALRDSTARHALATYYAAHAQFYRAEGRLGEIGPLAQRALAVVPEPDPRSGTFLWSVILNAVAAVYGGSFPAPERGIRLLRAWVERSTPPHYTAWMLSNMAEYAALAGETEASLALAERACRVAAQYERPVELYLRRLDHGRLLLAAGRPAEALRVLPEPDPELDIRTLPELWLLRAEAHGHVGEHAAAQEELQRADVLIKAGNRARLRPRLEGLAQRL